MDVGMTKLWDANNRGVSTVKSIECHGELRLMGCFSDNGRTLSTNTWIRTSEDASRFGRWVIEGR